MTLEVLGVTKRLGGRTILDGIDLSCGASEVVVIVGENGAGKSTLLRIVAGLLEPDRGEVRIGGALLNDGGLEARRALGYVPDATDALPDLRVDELMTLVGELKGARVARRGAKNDALAPLRERLGLDPIWGQRLATLSFGQRKRACVLAALIGAPQLLVLDEPSNGLDTEGVTLMRTLIDARRAQGEATLLTTNDRAFATSVAGSHYELKRARLLPVSAP